MKTLWAVACAVVVGGMILSSLIGCASATPKESAGGGANTTFSTGGSAPGQAQMPQASPGTPAERQISVPASDAPISQYRIASEDVLHVSVWENKELTLDVIVRPDGMISLPLIQDVQAAGLTATELATVIKNRLLAFIKVPQVFVIVTQVNAPKIYILGNVVRPGPYPLRGDMSVLQALSLAGGFSQFASPRKIKIVRNNGGKSEVRKINYYDMIDEGEGNYLLKPGDTIVVP